MPVAKTVHWNADEQHTLAALAMLDDRRGERARVLIAIDGLVAADAAAAIGVAPTTLTRWCDRFREHGSRGLDDRSRSGRPRTVTEREVLLTLLEPSEVPWTTRRIAERIGVSQSVVARAWSAGFAPSPEAEAAVGRRRVSLLGLRVDGQGAILVLGESGRSTRRTGGVQQARASLRTLLVLDAVSPTIGTGGATGFVSRLTAGRSDAIVISSSARTRSMRARHVVERWGSLLGPLADGLDEPDPNQLHELAKAAARWSASGDIVAFEWSAKSHMSRSRSDSALAMTRADPLEPSVTAVCSALVLGGGLGDGRLATGDLATLMGCSRDTARRALARLVAEGLLLPGGAKASRLIVPTSDEVLEVYAARRALGALLVRRAASEGPALDRTRDALEEFLRISATGEPWLVGEADLAFQDALAHDAGAPRIARLFGRLTQQLRLFIATLGLRYSYPSHDSTRDARDLLAAVAARNEQLALEIWRAKMSRAVGYMVHQLPPAGQARSTGIVRYLDANL